MHVTGHGFGFGRFGGFANGGIARAAAEIPGQRRVVIRFAVQMVARHRGDEAGRAEAAL